jgi:hypothetical protein
MARIHYGNRRQLCVGTIIDHPPKKENPSIDECTQRYQKRGAMVEHVFKLCDLGALGGGK